MEQETVRTKDAVEALISEIDLQASALSTKDDGLQKTVRFRDFTFFMSLKFPKFFDMHILLWLRNLLTSIVIYTCRNF